MNAIIIPIYQRPNELKRCFDSLKEARWPENTICILIDDASTDAETKKLFNEFHIDGVEIIRFINPVNQGIKKNLLKCYDFAFKYGCEIVINLDSDAIVKPEFFEVLLWRKNTWKDHIVTGFNSLNKNRDGSERHEIIKEHGQFYQKKSVGGINMVVHKEQYEKYIKPSLSHSDNWDRQTCINSMNDGKPIICIKPSVVQHIASSSSMNHQEEPDVACDFYSLKLDNITLFGADTSKYPELKKAAEISTRDIKFGDVKILTTPDVDFKNKEDYNYFMVKKLNDFITTDYVINIQWDGYILRHQAWDDDFYNWDMIGASWVYKDGANVGNGGFSMRSKKLLEILATDDEIKQTMPEDHQICRTYRKYLENRYQIKFAPVEVADKFSIEAYGSQVLPGANKYSGQFGFHGFNVDYTGSGLTHTPQKPTQQQQFPLRNNNMRGATFR